MNIAFIRGQYINNYELQSYYGISKKHPEINITGFCSLIPKHQVQIPTVKLFSPVDLPDFPKKLSILNRLVLGDAMYLLNLESKLKDFDIAHVRETYFHFSSQAIYAKKRGNVKKVLVTCSETIPFNHETIPGRKRLKQNVLKIADHFHCLTQKAKKCLIDEGVPEDKITVISYGVDQEIFTPIIKPQSKKIKALFVGRLENQKGVHELIEAYKLLKKEFKEFDLQVVGQGPEEQKFINIGIQPEFYPYSKMPSIMQYADFLVLPSKTTKFWEEYLGMVLLEAMACGLPVVSTKSGAIPEVVEDAGLLVNQGEPNELYKGMRAMIEQPQLRKKYQSLGLARVKTYYNATKVSEKLYNLYKKINQL